MDETSATRWQWLDFNGDRRISLEDVGGWFWHLLFLPGDIAVDLMLNLPRVSSLLGIGPESYGGVGSRTVSIMFWIFVLIVCGVIYDTIRELDRALTSWLQRQRDDFIRSFRVLRRRLTSAINMRRRRRADARSGIDVSEMTLAKSEAAVLNCYAHLGEARTLSAPEVSAVTKTSIRETQKVLLKLVSYRLLQPAFGTDEGHPTYEITQAGQIWLIER
jgi:hypothetical protein